MAIFISILLAILPLLIQWFINHHQYGMALTSEEKAAAKDELKRIKARIIWLDQHRDRMTGPQHDAMNKIDSLYETAVLAAKDCGVET